jgi:hypothetical protein
VLLGLFSQIDGKETPCQCMETKELLVEEK